MGPWVGGDMAVGRGVGVAVVLALIGVMGAASCSESSEVDAPEPGDVGGPGAGDAGETASDAGKMEADAGEMEEDAAVLDDGGGPEDVPLTDVPEDEPPQEPEPGCVFVERFEQEDAPGWPSVWREAGGVARADVVGGQGRLIPEKRRDPYSLARVFAPGCGPVSGEVSARVLFTEAATQGVGLYLRSSGGWLTHTAPPGSGYGFFLEGFRNRRVGLWREINGVEQEVLVPVGEPLPSGVALRARFRVEQIDARTTLLRGRVWPEGSPEPEAWDVEVTDATPSLQGQAGVFGIDAYSTRFPEDAQEPADVFIDDIEVMSLD